MAGGPSSYCSAVAVNRPFRMKEGPGRLETGIVVDLGFVDAELA